MLALVTQAPAFATSCFVIAPGPGSACLVLDPGAGSVRGVRALVEAHGLDPVAVAATHGHPDHVWDAAAVSEHFGVPFVLHAADADRLSDPAGLLGPGMAEAFTSLAGSRWRPPADVVAIPAGSTSFAEATGLDLGLHIDLLEAPGHTPGSTIFLVPQPTSPESVLPAPAGPPLPPASAVAFTGDVLFAGSIGRVDLPGGDGVTMTRTLRRLREQIPGEAWLLPGHGPSSVMSRELAANPYLDPRWLASDVL